MRDYVASQEQLHRTEDWESRERTWYHDIVGVETGGAGHVRLPVDHPGPTEPFTDEVIDNWLAGDFGKAERALSLLMAPQTALLPQHAADAALDAAFNCGPGILAPAGSGFARAVLELNLAKAATEILRWCMVVKDGRKVPNAGLLNRRKAEAALILSPDAPHPDTTGYEPVCAGVICNPDELHELDQERLAAFIQASRDEDYGARDLHDGSDPLDDERPTDPDALAPKHEPDPAA